jgi:hypothetical protein
MILIIFIIILNIIFINFSKEIRVWIGNLCEIEENRVNKCGKWWN